MHILAGLAALVGVLIFILYRVHNATQVAKDLHETAGDVGGAWRRHKWQRRSAGDTLDEVQDPRLAAVTMMVGLAGCEGELTQRQSRAIVTQAARLFSQEERAVSEMLAQGRFLSRDVLDLPSMCRRLATPIAAVCDETERRSLIGELEALAALESPASPDQRQAIDAASRALGVG